MKNAWGQVKNKYKPLKIPRKRPGHGFDWFKLLDAANIYSVQHRDEWQDKGKVSVSGWCVMTPKGRLLPSTFSVRRNTAMARCLEPALERFKGITSHLFSEWEKAGFKLVKVKWSV